MRQQADAGAAGVPWLNDWGLIFTSALGAPIGPSTLGADFAARVKAAGLAHMRLHDLRHNCATLLHEAGVDLKEISDLMGHSKVSITQDLYAHMTPTLGSGPPRPGQSLPYSLDFSRSLLGGVRAAFAEPHA